MHVFTLLATIVGSVLQQWLGFRVTTNTCLTLTSFLWLARNMTNMQWIINFEAATKQPCRQVLGNKECYDGLTSESHIKTIDVGIIAYSSESELFYTNGDVHNRISSEDARVPSIISRVYTQNSQQWHYCTKLLKWVVTLLFPYVETHTIPFHVQPIKICKRHPSRTYMYNNIISWHCDTVGSWIIWPIVTGRHCCAT